MKPRERMRIMIRYLYLFLALFCVQSVSGNNPEIVLDSDSRVRMEIQNPISAEKTAEREMTEYLCRIFGQSPGKAGKLIILRHKPKAGKEEFTIKSDRHGNVIIAGGRPRGVLYGVYYFLDRHLGVKWLTPDCEYVPRKDQVSFPVLDYHGKPAFDGRILQTEQHGKNTLAGRRWRARNLFNSGFGGFFENDPDYGEEQIFSRPAQCHGLFQIITVKKYFKTHPEFWALQNGKRTHRDARGLTADYCLTNPGLAETTVKECRTWLRKNPGARYISIQEGDFTRGYCDCEQCKELVKKCGGRESGRWVFFANRVAKGLKAEFPGVKVLIFAYTASRKPPLNIKAENNVCVQLCAWNNRRGVPYSHPKNRPGNELIKQLRSWKEICPNILLWDYTYTFGDTLLQSPDLLLNIDNLRTFREIGLDGIFTENGIPENIAFGMPFKSWLIPRAMWNPDECGSGEELERIFCEGYYGNKAGKYAAQYYKLLREVNRKQEFVNFTAGGSIGKAAFESSAVTGQAWYILKTALAAASDPVHKNRIRQLMLPVQYQLLRDYNGVKKHAGLTESMDDIASDMLKIISQDPATTPALKAKYVKNIKTLLKLKNIRATGSIIYGSQYPAKAYDGSIETLWHAAGGAGWCQIEFDKVRSISRITTVLGSFENVYVGEYEITGSLNGKDWFQVVPRRKIEHRQGFRWVWADDVLSKPVHAKFIRTIRDKTFIRDNVRNDVLLHEQWFNLQSLPKELEQKD
ncbi:MAG: DUF4838 domain-containing protein [Lentisphaerae bacterium]|nr:DUF4838 domain-containing protein [Lentisphaerota bacterium]